MTFCSKCGAAYADDQKFCGICGAPKEAAAGKSGGSGGEATAKKPENIKRHTGRTLNSTTFIMSIIMLAIFVLILFVRSLGGYTLIFKNEINAADILCLVSIAVAIFSTIFTVVFTNIIRKEFNEFSAKLVIALTILTLACSILYMVCENIVMAYRISLDSGAANGVSFVNMYSIMIVTASLVCAFASIASRVFYIQSAQKLAQSASDNSL